MSESIFPNLSDVKCKTMIKNVKQTKGQLMNEILRRNPKLTQQQLMSSSIDQLADYLEDILNSKKETPSA